MQCHFVSLRKMHFPPSPLILLGSFLELRPVACLDVSLLSAEGLPKTDVLAGLCDPFALLHVRQRQGSIKRSSTKHHTLNPTWNEGFLLQVMAELRGVQL